MERPKMARVSEEMRRVCALLGDEMLRWDGVTVRPMFGMRAFYRAKVVFAMLPEKRALGSPQAIAYKVTQGVTKGAGKKWKLFEIAGAEEIGAALGVLGEAYRKAGRGRRKSS